MKIQWWRVFKKQLFNDRVHMAKLTLFRITEINRGTTAVGFCSEGNWAQLQKQQRQAGIYSQWANQESGLGKLLRGDIQGKGSPGKPFQQDSCWRQSRVIRLPPSTVEGEDPDNIWIRHYRPGFLLKLDFTRMCTDGLRRFRSVTEVWPRKEVFSRVSHVCSCNLLKIWLNTIF